MICTDDWKVVFQYGSHIYGTNTSKSDEDFIVVGGYSPVEHHEDNKNIRVFPLQDFIVFLEMHEPVAFECVSVLKMNNNRYVRVIDSKFSNIIDKFYNTTLNLIKLRKAFSQKASNSIVKAKKKCLLEDEDYYIGMKSLFHSIRLMDFGTQIAKNKYITDFKSMSYVWHDILNKQNDFKSVKTEDEWKELIEPWKKLYNKKHSEFKSVTSK